MGTLNFLYLKMKTTIKIEKEDISTNRLGMNIEVKIDDKTSLVFTPEAIEELIKDYSDIKKEIQDQVEKRETPEWTKPNFRTKEFFYGVQLELPFTNETWV